MIALVMDISLPDFDGERYESAYRNMTPQRREKADRYKSLDDRRRCVFADELLRSLLREAGAAEELSFYTDKNGKPHLTGDRMHFSLSHSGDYVACAVDHSPVGMDIEVPRDVDMSIIKRVCTEEELQFVLGDTRAQTADKDTSLRFLQVWTAKEAYLKYTGEGLSGGLRSIAVATKEGMKTELRTGLCLESKVTPSYISAIVSEKIEF